MDVQLSEFGENQGLLAVSYVMYPLAHIGQIWVIPDTTQGCWEVRKIDRNSSQLVASGMMPSIEVAQEPMQATMRLWVNVRQRVDTADYEAPAVPPPTPPSGFPTPNIS